MNTDTTNITFRSRFRVPTGVVLCFAVLFAARGAAEEAAKDDGRVSKGVGIVEAYQSLLKENLNLREKIDDLNALEATRQKEIARKNATIKDLEKRVVELAGMTRELRRQQRRPQAPAEAEKLRGELKTVREEREKLQNEVIALRKRVDELRAEARPAERPVAPQVAESSDLYRRLEVENARLKRRLAELESERKQAVQLGQALEQKVSVRETELEQFEEILGARTEERDKLSKVIAHVRRMLANMRELRHTLARKEAKIAQRDERIEALQRAVEAERAKIMKIKRVAVLMDRIDRERRVQKLPESEKREAFRRAGDEYFDQGRFKPAEKEYLKALEIDPSYADAHYNLAVLYDTKLDEKDRAIRHYGAYLDLKPQADDAHLVRLWIREAELASAEIRRDEERQEERLAELMETIDAAPLDKTAASRRNFHMKQAELFVQQERYKDAVREYRQALEYDPNYADIHYNLGVIFDAELDDKEGAVRHYNAYLKLRPHASDSDRVRSWLADARMEI